MATIATTLPRPRRRPRNQPAAGRATFPDIYFVRPIDNSRLCREVDRKKRRENFALFGLLLLPFLLCMLLASQHFKGVRCGYQIEQLKAQRLALEEWNHQLRLEQASLADPQRIDRLARQGLGLASPAPGQVIRLGPPAARSTGRVELARNSPALPDMPREQ